MIRSHAMRTAGERDLGAVWCAVRPTRTFADRGEFEAAWREAPWRVQVSEAGDAALLGGWRDHSRLLAMQGLWCAEGDIPAIIGDVVSVARAQGFEGVLSPLVPEGMARPYLAAGMQVMHRGITLRLDRPADVARRAVDGVDLAVAGLPDAAAIEAVDSTCFDAFWRFDARMLRGYLVSERAVVAMRGATVIGYTLCTVNRGEGMLGRLAVLPEERGRGIGALLLGDAVAYMARVGVRAVTLYTQEENVPSRALYAKSGFRELLGSSCFLVTGVR